MKKIIILFFVSLNFIFYSCIKNPLAVDIPFITSTVPEDNSDNVKTDAIIKIFFSEQMDYATTESAFELRTDSEIIYGTYEWNDRTMIFKPNYNLKQSTDHFLTVNKNAASSKGVLLGIDFSLSFTVGNFNNNPNITSIHPYNGELLHTNHTSITITFSKSMDKHKTTSSFSISPALAGRFSWPDSTTMKYTITDEISYLQEYKIKLSTSASSEDNYPLRDEYLSFFRYGNDSFCPQLLGIYKNNDPTLPVSSRYIKNYETNISKYDSFIFHFNKDIDKQSFIQAFNSSPYLDGSFQKIYDSEGYKIIFSPFDKLEANKFYSFTVTTSLNDIYGSFLKENYYLYFYTKAPDSMPLDIRQLTDIYNYTWSGNNLNIFFTNYNLTNSFDLDLRIIFDPSENAAMDINSVQQNISISRLSGGGKSIFRGSIINYNWINNSNLLLLKLSDIGISNYYKLTFNGGNYGIKDTQENFLANDIEYIFSFLP